MSYEDEPLDPSRGAGESDGARDVIADKVKIPAIFLIIVGVLNIFGALWIGGEGVMVLANPDMINRNMEQMNKQFNLPKQEIGAGYGIFYLAQAAVGLLAAAITIFGGIRMVGLKSYALAVSASVIAAVPCVSTMGCCCVGEAVGIWCLIVLLSADVKAAFR